MAVPAPLATAHVAPSVVPGMMPLTLLAVAAATVPKPVLEKSNQPPGACTMLPKFRVLPETTEIAAVPPALRLVVVKDWVVLPVRV